jgi:hypothetical protein
LFDIDSAMQYAAYVPCDGAARLLRQSMPSDTTTTAAHDRDEILRVHGVWMRANCGLDVAGLREAFVGGDHFQGFNLNAYTYNQRDEWERLWRYLRTVMDITGVCDEKVIRLEIRGDMAWLAFESTLTAQARKGAGSGTSGVALPDVPTDMRLRGTEIFVRADEAGRPVWKMWHCHYSPCAPADTPRPGF